MTDLVIRPQSGVVTLALAAWLDAKAGRSQSAETRVKYRSTLESFRAATRTAGLDLDADPDALGLLAQAWAGASAPAAATYNQRLAIVSSFYTFAHKRALLRMANPIAP